MHLSLAKRVRLFRVIGLLLVVVGWLYLFGGRSGARQPVAASVIDRLIFVPLVFLPLAYAGVFPHLLVTFAISIPCWELAPGFSSLERLGMQYIGLMR